MKKKRELSASQSDLAVSFYDMAADHPRESFEMIAKRVAPKGLGKSGAFKKDARKMYELAR